MWWNKCRCSVPRFARLAKLWLLSNHCTALPGPSAIAPMKVRHSPAAYLCHLEKKTATLLLILAPSGWKPVYHLLPRSPRGDIPAAESLGRGWVETWKDGAALMWSMWNPQLNPNNPGVNPTWARSNRPRLERTASHTLAEQNVLLATLIWACFNIVLNLHLYSHISQPDHMDNRWACKKNGWGQQVNMGLWFTWGIPEGETEKRSGTSWL